MEHFRMYICILLICEYTLVSGISRKVTEETSIFQNQENETTWIEPSYLANGIISIENARNLMIERGDIDFVLESEEHVTRITIKNCIENTYIDEEAFIHLHHVTKIEIANCGIPTPPKISGSRTFFFICRSLTFLSLARNRISEFEDGYFAECEKLIKLNLRLNRLKAIPDLYQTRSTLYSLDISFFFLFCLLHQ